MLFSSMIFLWVFLPVVIGGNFLFNLFPFKSESTRIRLKNIFLLIASLFFYAWGGIYYLLIMISSILLNFAGGYFLEVWAKTKAQRRGVLAIVVALNLLILFFFKYFNMLIAVIESCMKGGGGIMNALLKMEGTGALGLAGIVLPIGISFFTFQAMSYVMDVYMGNAKIQPNIIDFALYVSLFPQLIAGPIVRYSDVDLQLRHRKESLSLFYSGQQRFCFGLVKKVLVSNTVAKIADDIWALETESLGAAMAWLGIVAYTLQIYYDFSGYSDMAIGLGRMFGFNFKENFDYPYTSLSVQEFWRRWHISLSTWFREYIYIPLGGNRKGKARTYLNLLIVWCLTGIWHGANFTFMAWGLFYAALLMIERLFLGKVLKANPIKPLNWIYTIFAVMIGWIYFRSDNIAQANTYVRELFDFSESRHSIFTYLSMRAIIVIVLGILLCGFVQRPLKALFAKLKTTAAAPVLASISQIVMIPVNVVLPIVTMALPAITLVGDSYNPFIYFQF